MRQPTFWNLIKAENGQSAELRIIGDIVDDDTAWFYEWLGWNCTSPGEIRAQLADLGGAPLTVWIDSYGGDVVAASAIYTALMEYKGDVTGKIDGAAYSAASIIAMACDKVLMSPTATMMIHLPWTRTEGNANDMRHTADVLDQVSETLINAYEIKTGKPRSEINALLEAETWMSAQKAISLGFADGMLYEWESETAQDGVVAQAKRVYAMAKKGKELPAMAKTEEDDWAKRAAMRLALEEKRT